MTVTKKGEAEEVRELKRAEQIISAVCVYVEHVSGEARGYLSLDSSYLARCLALSHVDPVSLSRDTESERSLSLSVPLSLSGYPEPLFVSDFTFCCVLFCITHSLFFLHREKKHINLWKGSSWNIQPSLSIDSDCAELHFTDYCNMFLIVCMLSKTLWNITV